MERSGKRIRVCENEGTPGGASGAHTLGEGHGVAPSSGYDYEVFLSFRGPDTRAGFTDFLYTSLKDTGIRTFKDDEDLRKGEEFAPELLRAIKESKISIPIFSKDYASSVWCLKEVVQMVKCKETEGQKIIPIFYDVAPAEVRYQSGGYGEAFLLHESKERYDRETITEWKAALSAVGAITGWDLHSMTDRREGGFAKSLADHVFRQLKKAYLVVSDCLVNVDNHVDAIEDLIVAHTSETWIIGIHGMGGIGKTTTAKIIYNQLSEDFEGCCFLPDIREVSEREGIQCLQKQLISNIQKTKCEDVRSIDDGIKIIKERLSSKKVLLLLDDVHEKNQIDALVGGRDWLARGSKVIITTRNKEVLDILEVDNCYELTAMDRTQSLQLFSKHAFRRDSPLDDFINQSNKALDIAGGLPLALEVIGSLLRGVEKKEIWDATLKKMESVPRREIKRKLQISYDALDFRQQRIFLDIACLFIGYKKDRLVHFWDEPDHFPLIDMQVLQDRSLIKINENNEVWMHDQLIDLGREIVREKSDMKIGKKSRVWDRKEGAELLRRPKGNKEVEVLRLGWDHQRPYCFTYEGFENLSHLRFLQIEMDDDCYEDFRAEERLLWHESPSIVIPTNEKSDLLPQLRWLSWFSIPPTFNISNFSMENVVFLDLFDSGIMDDWKGWSHMKMMKNLKVLDLSLCSKLRRLPDELGVHLASLEYLSLSGCESLEMLPNTIGNLKSLIELDISGTQFKKLPDSIGMLQNLKVMNMSESSLEEFNDAFWTLERLEQIERSMDYDPYFHLKIGECIYKNQSLRILNVRLVDIYELPRLPHSLIDLQIGYLHMDTFPDLSNLTNLEVLDLTFDSSDSEGRFHGPVEDWTPWWIGNLTKLESLGLSLLYNTAPEFKAFRLPRLPSSLCSLHLDGFESLCSIGDLSNLKKLSSLKIVHSGVVEIQGLGCLENLRDLDLHCLPQLQILPDLSNLNKLRSLLVSRCDNLVEIQGEPPRYLDKFKIYQCSSLRKLPDLSTVMCKTIVEVDDWSKLNVEAILGFARKNPRDLRLVGFPQLHIVPNLSNLRDSNELRSLKVQKCSSLIEIQGELPRLLEELVISSCECLLKLPDLWSLKELQKIVIEDCRKLNWEAIIGVGQRSQVSFGENLQHLWLSYIGSMEILPDLSNSNKLRSLHLVNCGDLIEIQGKLPQSLEDLQIQACKSLQKLPDLSSLKALQRVIIKYCEKLDGESILGFAWRNQTNSWDNLQFLWLSGLRQVKILPDLSFLNKLKSLRLRDCGDLVEIEGKLPESLEELVVFSCQSLHKFPDLSSLKELQRVIIGDFKNLRVEASLDFAWMSLANVWENLRYLWLSGFGQVKMLHDLSNLSKLERLGLTNFGDLVEIQGELPKTLESLEIYSCESLQELPDLSSLKNLLHLTLSGLGQVIILPDLSNSIKLKILQLRNCGSLVEIQGKLPESLEELQISSCESLQNLPDLSSLNGLRMVKIIRCGKLNVEAISCLCLEKSVKLVVENDKS